MMTLFRILVAPFTLLYVGILYLRNLCYNKGLLTETSFELPIINVGNLAFGGTGKTPHIEYLIHLLKPNYKVAVLSRGYKRKTIGYFFASNESTAAQIGDEPRQIKQKFKDEIDLAVSENRVIGVPNLLFDAPETDIILLDDAFQHRAIKAGLNILLTDYNNLFTQDYLTPSGTLREYRAGYKRADIIIVTKCNADLSDSEKQQIIAEIKPLAHQKVYFSYQKFSDLVHYYNNTILPIHEIKNTDLLVASHIVPWSVDEKNRLNPRNGLCLNALHDKAFDKYLITITPNLKLKVSKKLKDESKNKTMVENFIQLDGHEIKLPKKFLPDEKLLLQHNKVFAERN